MTNELSLGRWGRLARRSAEVRRLSSGDLTKLQARKLDIKLLATDASPIGLLGHDRVGHAEHGRDHRASTAATTTSTTAPWTTSGSIPGSWRRWSGAWGWPERSTRTSCLVNSAASRTGGRSTGYSRTAASGSTRPRSLACRSRSARRRSRRSMPAPTPWATGPSWIFRTCPAQRINKWGLSRWSGQRLLDPAALLRLRPAVEVLPRPGHGLSGRRK